MVSLTATGFPQLRSGMSNPLSYVLISPARNEEQYIELTLRSMIAQTQRPVRWVIVSDGSTDRTDEIVASYVEEHPWIELLRMPERVERHFAGKVHAFNAGYERVKNLDFDVVGNLDADVSFEPEHFEFLIRKMREHSELGMAGAPFREGTFQYDYRFTNIENVWGGCQLFRRACYEAIGGYMPLKGGCIDHVAVISARFHGWKTRTFPEKVCMHHRKMGTAQQSDLAAKFKLGVKDHSVGNHPLWQLSRTIYQMSRRPFVVGGLALGSGYAWAMVRGSKIPLPPDMVRFVRREQMVRLKRFFVRKPAATIGATSGPNGVATPVPTKRA
jgi:poly-beta-1,6-N-acetyl-D-glucosamine synthase